MGKRVHVRQKPSGGVHAAAGHGAARTGDAPGREAFAKGRSVDRGGLRKIRGPEIVRGLHAPAVGQIDQGGRAVAGEAAGAGQGGCGGDEALHGRARPLEAFGIGSGDAPRAGDGHIREILGGKGQAHACRAGIVPAVDDGGGEGRAGPSRRSGHEGGVARGQGVEAGRRRQAGKFAGRDEADVAVLDDKAYGLRRTADDDHGRDAGPGQGMP